MKRTNYSFYVLMFFALAVGSAVIAILNKAFPLFASKTLFLCQKLISNVMLEIPRSLPSAFILAIGIVLGIGFLSFLLQLSRTHFLLRKLFVNKVELPKRLVTIIEGLGLINKVTLVKDTNLVSFCYGIFSPHIVVSTALVGFLTDKELEAILLHEQSHLLSRDPIKVLIGKTFSSMFFFLPVFRELHKNIEAVNELIADQWVINYQEKTIFLRGALRKILLSPQPNFVTVSNASGPDCFEIRLNRLVNPGIKYKFRVSLKSLITSILFIFLSGFLLLTPINASHMDSKSNSNYSICSTDQICTRECHSSWKEEKSYIPSQTFLPEKKCDDNSHSAKTNLTPFSAKNGIPQGSTYQSSSIIR